MSTRQIGEFNALCERLDAGLQVFKKWDDRDTPLDRTDVGWYARRTGPGGATISNAEVFFLGADSEKAKEEIARLAGEGKCKPVKVVA